MRLPSYAKCSKIFDLLLRRCPRRGSRAPHRAPISAPRPSPASTCDGSGLALNTQRRWPPQSRHGRACRPAFRRRYPAAQNNGVRQARRTSAENRARHPAIGFRPISRASRKPAIRALPASTAVARCAGDRNRRSLPNVLGTRTSPRSGRRRQSISGADLDALVQHQCRSASGRRILCAETVSAWTPAALSSRKDSGSLPKPGPHHCATTRRSSAQLPPATTHPAIHRFHCSPASPTTVPAFRHAGAPESRSMRPSHRRRAAAAASPDGPVAGRFSTHGMLDRAHRPGRA